LGDSIRRRNIIPRKDSAVYNSQFAHFPTIPRHLGLEGLNDDLVSSSIAELECMWSLHQGLQGHYRARYASKVPSLDSSPAKCTSKTTSVESPAASRHSAPTQQQSEHSSRVISLVSDDGMYVSARSSLTSLLAEEFKSVNEISVEDVKSAFTKQKKKPSNLNIDLITDLTDFDDPDLLHSGYRGIVASRYLHTATLQIPCSSRYIPLHVRDHTSTADSKPNEHVKYKVHHRKSASDTSFLLQMRGPSPDSTPTPTHFQLQVPCLAKDSVGTLPRVVQKAQTLEQRPRANTSSSEDQPTAQHAKFFVSVQFSGSHRAVLSPPLLNIISRYEGRKLRMIVCLCYS